MPEVFVTSNIEDMQRALEQLPARITRGVMRDVSEFAERETLKLYGRTTRTWDHDVQFDATKHYTASSYTVTVGTDDDVYKFVDEGTRPHEIRPKRPGYPLRFQGNYKAKTAVGVLGSGAGGSSGPWIRAMRVWHPGTQARKFTEKIFEQVGRLANERTIKSIGEQIRKYIRARGQRPI